MLKSIRMKVVGCMGVDGNFREELIVEVSIVGLDLFFHVHVEFFEFLILLLGVLNSDCILWILLLNLSFPLFFLC